MFVRLFFCSFVRLFAGDFGQILPPQLKSLQLSNNLIATLPSSLGLHQHLEKLYLNNNKIDSIPETYLVMARLEILHLQYNQIDVLPTLEILENATTTKTTTSIIQRLNLSYNRIHDIPVEWFVVRDNNTTLFPKLNVFSLHGNLLGGVPIESVQEIRNYYQLDLLVRKFKPLIKIVLMGDENRGGTRNIENTDGKTYLFNKLTKGGRSNSDGSDGSGQSGQSGRSIEVGTEVDVALAVSKPFHNLPFDLEIWKLPGMTNLDSHAMFLKDTSTGNTNNNNNNSSGSMGGNTIYVIVFNIKQIVTNDVTSIDNVVRDWIKKIQQVQPGARILLVASGCNGVDKNVVKNKCNAVEARIHLCEKELDDEIEQETEKVKLEFGEKNNDRIILLGNMKLHRRQWPNIKVIPLTTSSQADDDENEIETGFIEHILKASTKIFDSFAARPIKFPRLWNEVVHIIRRLKSSSSPSSILSSLSPPSSPLPVLSSVSSPRLFITMHELKMKYARLMKQKNKKKQDTMDTINNYNEIVEGAVKWLAKHNEVEDCSSTLGVIMLQKGWSSMLISCVLNPSHIRCSLSKEDAEHLLSTGILKHQHLELLLDSILDQMKNNEEEHDDEEHDDEEKMNTKDEAEGREEKYRNCSIVLLYEMLRHYEVVVALHTKKETSHDDNVGAGGALDSTAESLVPSLLRFSTACPWSWPCPDDVNEYNRTIYFRYYKPPGIMPRLYARAHREGFYLHSKTSILYRDAAVLEFRHSGVHVGFWMKETCLEIFCRSGRQTTKLVAFTAIETMCRVALSVMNPESYPGTPFQVKVSCPMCARNGVPGLDKQYTLTSCSDNPPQGEWALSDVRECMEIVGCRNGSHRPERRFEQDNTITNTNNSERPLLCPCSVCGTIPQLNQLVFVEEDNSNGPSTQHMQMLLQQQKQQLLQQQQQLLLQQQQQLFQQQQMFFLAQQQQLQHPHQYPHQFLSPQFLTQQHQGAIQYQIQHEQNQFYRMNQNQCPGGASMFSSMGQQYYYPMAQHRSMLPSMPLPPPPVPPVQNSFQGVVRIGVATQIPFEKKGTYSIQEMGSGVLLEVEVEVEANANEHEEHNEHKEQQGQSKTTIKVPIVVTAAHVVLDQRSGWKNLKYDPSTTKIFIGVYRAADLASRWLFEINVDSLLCSAAINHARKGGPKGRCGKCHSSCCA